jgi:hypothetical protein
VSLSYVLYCMEAVIFCQKCRMAGILTTCRLIAGDERLTE